MSTWYDISELSESAQRSGRPSLEEKAVATRTVPARRAREPNTAIEQLKRRLAEDRVTRLALTFLDKYEGVHLKDLVVDRMDDQRGVRICGREVVNFGSDSFLGLDRHSRVQQALAESMADWGTHNGASRAFSSAALCDEAERRLADWLDVEDTLIYPSVTLANVGLLPAVAGKGDLLVVDRTSHDSLQQAAKIAAGNGATVRELHPCCGDALRKILRNEDYDGCVVAVDGVYSMTGIIPPLDELDEVTRRFGGILYVDDAHGTAIVGPRGRGAARMMLGSLDDVLMVGSLSKAFSCLGAFVTCDTRLKRILKIRSSTFIFGGPVPPPYLAAVCAVCEMIESSQYDTLIGRLRSLTERLTAGIRSIGLTMAGGEAAIVSVTIGDLEQTLRAGKWLFDRGFYVQSATYPAVPIMGGLLRIQVNANHTAQAIDDLLGALADLKTEFGLPDA